MFSVKSTRRRNVNPRLSGWENLESRKMMAGDGLPGFGFDFGDLPLDLPGDIFLPGPQDPLVGKWEHADPFTGGITEIEISKDGDGYEIDAKGACVPTDCDWGETDLYALGTSVSDTTPDYAYGSWDHGFKDATVTIDIRDNGLALRLFNVYKDGSGRENFYDEYFLSESGKIYDVVQATPRDDVGDILLGGWVNEDQDTRGVTKLHVTEDGGVNVKAWGACSPTDCNWGEVSMDLLGTSISDNTYEFATADWDHGFSTTFMTTRAVDGELKIDTYTVFHDGSGRSNYHSSYDMWKVGDSNHDGHFSSGDLIQAFIAAEYEDRIRGNSTWEEGDWNRDGDFNSSDFVEAFRYGSYDAPSLSGRLAIRDAAIAALLDDLDLLQIVDHDFDFDLPRRIGG